MAKTAGRLFLIKIGGTVVGGGRTTGMDVAGSPIDITDQNDAGVQTLLVGAKTGRAVNITFDGVEEDQVLRDMALGPEAGQFIDDLTLEYPAVGALSSDIISGSFVLGAYSESGAYEDAMTFSSSFTSNGAWTFTKGA